MSNTQPKFQLGQVVMTPGVAAILENMGDVDASRAVFTMLQRHMVGDCGDMCEEDKLSNEQAIAYGSRVMSSYKLGDETIWIITEADRSVTTLLLPEEY